MATTSTTKKILTIDDEQAIVDLIVDILESNNYTAISATKWTDAMNALNHENPDLILLDLKMPTIHGTSMLEFIVSEGFDIPVIVVSGFVTEQVSQELRAQGVKGIVKKPFKARALLDEIEKHLQTGQMPAEPAQDAMSALYNRPAAPAPDAPEESAAPSMDALYGAPTENTKKTPPTNQPPAQDILQALKRNAPPSEPADKTDAGPAATDLLDALKKQTPAKQEPPPQKPEMTPPPEPKVPISAETPPTPGKHPKSNGPPPMAKPPEVPTATSALSGPPPTSKPNFGVREHSSRPRRARRKMDKGNMMFMGAITVVCVLVAGFLAVMQWVASEAPVALEQMKSDIESGVNSQMQQQMQQMKQQMQTQQIQQQLQKSK